MAKDIAGLEKAYAEQLSKDPLGVGVAQNNRRERIATAVLAGLAAAEVIPSEDPGADDSLLRWKVQRAVAEADALIAELDKS